MNKIGLLDGVSWRNFIYSDKASNFKMWLAKVFGKKYIGIDLASGNDFGCVTESRFLNGKYYIVNMEVTNDE